MAENFDAGIRGSTTVRDDRARRNLSKSENTATPVTPPARFISSTYSTPGSTFGQEQDAVIIELTPRYIKAGIEGESNPQCRYNFTPTTAKRLGDYRQYLPNFTHPRELLEKWGDGYELWRNDLKNVDLGLLKDRLERAVREVYNKNLLVDAGSARLVLVVPSLLPHPVLAAILQTLFERWTYPSITLVPTSATTLLAAGLRSGLVVDIGWEETVVTALYEYREVKTYRTTKAMKTLTKNVGTWIQRSLQAEDRFDLQLVEDVVRRVGQHICAARDNNTATESTSEHSDDVEVDWPTDTFTRSVRLSHQELQTEIVGALLGKPEENYPDDEELPLQRVLYKTLLAVPQDIRGICISRIVFIGDGSNNQPLISAVLTSFNELLKDRTWSGVDPLGSRSEGPKYRTRRAGLSELAQARAQPADVRHDDSTLSNAVSAEERYLREKAKHNQPIVYGIVRQVDSMGPWTGASLMTTLRVKSMVEIQRERFLSHGLGGATRELDVSVVPQQGRGPLATRSKAGERTSWTLSGWG